MEYDIAQDLGKPLYVFVCGGNFPYGQFSPEAEDLTALQVSHREVCLSRAEFSETVNTVAQLEKRVSQLPEHLRRLELRVLETTDALETVGSRIERVESLQRVTNNKLDKQSDKSTKDIRADLRAKLSRAEDLHVRDEGKEAVGLLEEMYHIARSHGLNQEQLEATLNLGLITSVKHDFKSVERRLREVAKLIRYVGDAWHRIQYHRLKSKVLLHKGHVIPAEKVLQKAIGLSRSDDPNVTQAVLLARADYIHLLCDAKRPHDACDHLAKVREAVELTDDKYPVALMAELLEACIHWAATNADIKEVNTLVALALRHGEGRAAAACIAHALHNCANGARGMKATEVAVICAEAAERLGRAAQRADIALAAAYTAAGALAEKEEYHDARERCLRLLDAANSLAEPTLRFCLFQLLSQVSRQLGDNSTAVHMAEAALRNTEGQGTGLCLAKLALAEALRDCGRVKEAIEHARAAYQLSAGCDLPPEWAEETIGLIADCAARLGEWTTADDCLHELSNRTPRTPGSSQRRKAIEARIQMYRRVRESLTSVIRSSMPLSEARTKGAESVHAANASLMGTVIEAWREYPNAVSAIYDYWGRGNFSRFMLNTRAFPSAFNVTLEVHTIDEIRQAVRLWALIADVLILIWKGPTVSSHVVCPVPWSFSTSGGGGYLAAPVVGKPTVGSVVTGMSSWKEDLTEDSVTPVIMTRHASLLPEEIGRFMYTEAAQLIGLGRLIIVPSTGICCIGAGHGPLESLFAEACNAIPAIKGDAARFPASWVPYFPDIPLSALADVVQSQEVAARRLRLLLIRKSRQFLSGGVTGSEAKELELEIQDSLDQLTDAQSNLRRRYGWGEAREAVTSRMDGFSEQEIAPIFVLQSMGYRWRVEHAVGHPAPETKVLPKDDEVIGTWLHPPDTKPEFLTSEQIRSIKRKMRRKRK